MSSLYWLRNDLRIEDNRALQFFINCGGGAIVYNESKSFKKAQKFRREFIESELSHFAFLLKQLNGEVYRSQNDILQTLELLYQVFPFDKIIYTKEFAIDEVLEEWAVEKFAASKSIKVISFFQSTLIHPEDLPFSIKNMPLVFTDFRKAIEKQLKLRSPAKIIESMPNGIELALAKIKPLEKKDTAINRLEYYFFKTQKVLNYKNTRNGMIEYDDSTKLSKWLSTGSISPLMVYYQLRKFESSFIENESTYWVFFELLWRDYFKFLSLKYKSKIFQTSGIFEKNIFEEHPDEFNKWKNAKTGVDFIDANMIELNATGFMSNRGRQNVASFLIHDLKVNWVRGAEYFEEMLIDYDPDVNYGNWLYLSGNGTDPRSRKFNIEKQKNDYDPHGLYCKLWLNPISAISKID